jgi:hypothetical protein
MSQSTPSASIVFHGRCAMVLSNDRKTMRETKEERCGRGKLWRVDRDCVAAYLAGRVDDVLVTEGCTYLPG